MTAPALSWGLFGRGAPGPAQASPLHAPADGAPLLAAPEPVAGPAERALLEASRELAGMHPLDRLEHLEAVEHLNGGEHLDAAEHLDGQPPAGPVPADVPWAAPPVLDVLPTGAGRRRTMRDAVLPLVLLGELLVGVWLGTDKPWQGDDPDPMQARWSSTSAPADDDLRLPGPVPPATVPGLVGLLPTARPATAEPSQPGRAVDPFLPR